MEGLISVKSYQQKDSKIVSIFISQRQKTLFMWEKHFSKQDLSTIKMKLIANNHFEVNSHVGFARIDLENETRYRISFCFEIVRNLNYSSNKVCLLQGKGWQQF